MIMLIIGRAIAGVGLGGLFTLVLLIISDLTTPIERPKWQGLIGAVYGVSSVLGPVVGGVSLQDILKSQSSCL